MTRTRKITYGVFLYLVFSVIFCHKTLAQVIKLQGEVIEKTSKSAIPFATLYFLHAKTGVVCDENGKFLLPIPSSNDSLQISAMGFKAQTILITGSRTDLQVELEENTGELAEAQVIGYKDPGKALIKKVIAHKLVNDPDRLRSFERNEYLKTEIDLLNLKQTSGKGTLQLAARIYNQIAADSTGGYTLPVYFTEQLSSLYHTKAGDTNVRTLLSKKTMNLSMDQLGPKFDKFYIVPGIYDGIIPILKTSFIGPVSDIGLGFYHFEILDTLAGPVHRTLQVSFTPKSSNENTFYGQLWIEEDTYAITKVSMQTSENVNLNFIRSFKVEQQYQQIQHPDNDLTEEKKGKAGSTPDSVWVLSANNTSIRFHNGLQLFGLPIGEDTTGKQVVLNNNSVFSGYKLNIGQPTMLGVSQGEGLLTEDQRLTPLSSREQAIYTAVDSLRNNKDFNRGIKLTTLIATGYWDFANRLRVGPLSSLVSGNFVEGTRIRLGVWTLEGFNKQWNLNGYLAYGFRDNRWKMGVGIKYLPSRAPYSKTEFILRQDYDMITENDDEMDMDNIFTLGLRKNIPAYQVFTRQLKVQQEYDLNHNWSAKFFLNYKDMNPTFPLNYHPEGLADMSPLLHTISTSEAGINLRYAHNERTTIFNYDKIRIYTRFPVINFHYVKGFEMLPGNHFDYDKINVGLMQEFNMPIKGSFYYNLNFGKVFGTLPYLLLNVPRGNPYYVSSKYAFNNMRPYEFVADRYSSLMMRYSMGGLILDHVPLLQKFHVRERLIGNLYWGDMNAANKELNKINPVQTTGKTPYAEAGFGFENIFNVLTIDAVWRLNHNGQNIGGRFGIFTGVKIAF